MRVVTTSLLSSLLVGLGSVMPITVLGQDEGAGATVEILPRKDRSPAVSAREFYDVKMSLGELRQQMNQLRVDVEAYRSREMTPDIYRTILKQLQPPNMTHEVVLTNGTVVRGNITSENIDQLTIETSLGLLTLNKSDIRSINEMTHLQPKLDFMGDAKVELHDTHRLYVGKLRNSGISRGDFVRVIFRLWNAQAELVAVDSAFVDGNTRAYLSGVITDSALGPGQEADYRVRVEVPSGNPVSYVTREIHFEHRD
ncbi:MAG: hypothetical protein IIB42_02245 [Candidatus Marinimicrobia bacterium]|nr:hypothetical protein [Candidatus Neomarinimicrobiota bacterium]